MGLLDSPYVGQLVKRGTVTVNPTVSGWIFPSDIDCAGYNTCAFKISLSGFQSNTNVQLRGGVIDQGLQSIKVSKALNYNNELPIFEINESGSYITTDLTAMNFINFNYYKASGQSDSVSITIDYVLSYSNNSISSELAAVANNELLIVTLNNLDCTDTGNTILEGVLSKLKGKKYLRVNVQFSAIDSNVDLRIINATANDTFAFANILVREDGLLCSKITANDNKTKQINYYIKNVTDRINIRRQKAGSSGLTCTINLYATDILPDKMNIQELFSQQITQAGGASQTYSFTFDPVLMKYFRFFYCSIGNGDNSSYNFNGSISKNWITNEADDDETLIDFTNKKNVLTKWMPVSALSGKITFNIQNSGDYFNTYIYIYGVV